MMLAHADASADIGLSLRQHPLAFLRAELIASTTISCEELQRTKDGRYVTVAGLVLVRQRPGSAKGVMFITIEDEDADANLIIWPRLFEESRRIVMGTRLLGVYDQVQCDGEVTHVIAKRLTDLSPMLSKLGNRAAPFPAASAAAMGRKMEEGRTHAPASLRLHPRATSIFRRFILTMINVKARNFR